MWYWPKKVSRSSSRKRTVRVRLTGFSQQPRGIRGVAINGLQEVRSAIAAHNKSAQGELRVPTGASAYSFRHARISELLQIYGVDPLTVAAQTGTSLRMIERTYFKFIRSAMLEKLASLKTNPAAANLTV